jgi:glycosyltransferase involved in cell wall biosynthesis
MKIAFNRRQENPTIGPFIFLERLIAYLKKNGVEVVRNPGRYHELHFINISGSGRNADHWKAKKLLRVDGIYYDTSMNSAEQNKGIRDTYHSVDAIVFQCEFARKMLYKHFGKPQNAKYETIIHNGVDDSFSPQGNKFDHGFKHTIAVSGKWSWKSKRLNQITECFLALNRQDLGLVILGEAPNQIIDSRIKYLGFVPPDKLPSYYRGADIMMHAAYVDWCPNSVVEALASGLPVLTTHNGGVPELIRGSGIIIKNEPDYNLEFIDHDNLPKLNPVLVGEAIDILLHRREDFIKSRPDLTIEHCGKQYLDFFKKVLS